MSLVANRVLDDGVDGVIEELIALSSLDEKIDRLSVGIIGNIENDRNSMSVVNFDKYKKVIISSFDSSVLKKNVRATILECYDGQKMGQMVAFLKHPHAVFMARKEEASKAPAMIQKMQNFFAGLQVSPPTEKRKCLIEQIDKLKRSSSFIVGLQVELFQAITWGMRGLSVDDQKITEDQLKQVALDMKVQLGAHMEQQVWMNMLFAYKDVSDSELEEYISLYESVEGALTTEFTQSVYSDVHKQGVGRLQCTLDVEFG